MMSDVENAKIAVREFDALACSQQVEMISNMLMDAVERDDMHLVEATPIPPALIRNRVALLEER